MIKMSPIEHSKQIPDAEIIKLILAGDTAPFEIIIRRYNPYLYKTGRSYGFNHHDTEDIMQETFINAFMNLKRFENRSSFKTWIVRIMLNGCFQKKKSFSFKNEIPTEFQARENYQQMFTSKPKNADSNVFTKELNHIVENALKQIPTDYRMVFSLRELCDFSVAETSEAQAISENNVKVRLNRARKMLRTEIEKMYSPEDIYEFNLIYCDSIVARVMSALNPS